MPMPRADSLMYIVAREQSLAASIFNIEYKDNVSMDIWRI